MKRHIAGIVFLLFCSVLHAAPALFCFDDVIQRAQDAANGLYMPQTVSAENPLVHLSYDQYRSVRFKSSQAVWADASTNFRVETLPVGQYSSTPVQISFVKNGIVSEFHAGSDLYAHAPDIDLSSLSEMPLSGFRVLTHLNSAHKWDEFLVFQGASYFRAVGSNQLYGISCRGLVVQPDAGKTEEFPVFTSFWIEQPASDEKKVQLFALLESASVTGAYAFTVIPGSQTLVQVRAVLFSRKTLHNIGISPLTSMFYFDGSNSFTADDYRTGSHDSDHFFARLSTGEQIVRQLINPAVVSYSSFCSIKPLQFGLLQRERDFAAYQDFETHYEKRPSALVVPGKTWPEGSLELIEIPTADDTNDNIVSYWKLRDALVPGHPVTFDYTISFSADADSGMLASVRGTRSGLPAYGKKDYRIYAVDFSHTAAVPSDDSVIAEVSCSTGTISGIHLENNPVTGGRRLYFELHPDNHPLIELRARLVRDGKPVSETWLYRWSAEK
jgi:periplasmic glucans biosynthesis protein